MKIVKTGFTLIEVLVALVIFGMVFVALLTQSARLMRWQGGLDERVLAISLAQNHIMDLRAEREWPAAGGNSLVVQQGGTDWEIKTVVETTPYKNLRKLTVSVHKEDSESSLTQLVTFLGEH